MGRANKKRRKWRADVVLFVAALAAVAIWRAWPRERQLMDVARPLVKTDAEKTEVCWLSAHQLLIVTTEREASFDTQPQQDWKGYADLLDTATNNRSRLTALTDLLDRTSRAMIGPNTFELSPDGTWLLWETATSGDGWPQPCAAHLDGTHYREWGRNRDEDTFFLDSHSLVQMTQRDPMMVRDLLDPKNDREYPKPEQAEAILARYAAHKPEFIGASYGDEPGTYRSVEIRRYRTQGRLQNMRSHAEGKDGPEPIQTWEVRFPSTATLQSTDVSPQETALCFDRVISQTPPLLVWLHRVFPKFDPKPTLIEKLSVSRIDGKGMHEIGQVPTQLNLDGSPEFALREVRWLPNGKQISFICHGTLYVVSAELEK